MSEFLFSLLPRVYRELDEQGDRSLEALLAVIENERQLLESDAAQLYDNWFIETCEAATVPAIAALLGLDHNLTRRGSVANAMAARRRKGTFAALEHTIADATGWAARADLQGDNDATLRISIWRQSAIAVTAATPFRLSPGRYTFNPMGVDVPLWHLPATNYDIERPYTAQFLPTRLSTGELAHGTRSLAIEWRSSANATPVSLPFLFADLSEWKRDSPVGKSPGNSGDARAFVDPRLGRFLLFDEAALEADGAILQVSYAFAASADIGGGPYPRPVATPLAQSQSQSQTQSQTQSPEEAAWLAYVHPLAPSTGCPDYLFPTLQAALEAFRQVSCCGTIRILDSATYAFDEIVIGPEFCGCGPLPDSRRTLTIDALSDQIPCLRGDLRLVPSAPGLNIVLSNLWINGEVLVGGDLNLSLDRCTIRPQDTTPPTQVSAVPRTRRGIHTVRGEHPNLRLELIATICGPIHLPANCAGLTIMDSIVDSIAGIRKDSAAGPQTDPTARVPGPHTQLIRSTVLARVDSSRLQTSDSIVAGDLPGGTALFMSVRYGDPGFARLRDDGHEEQLSGATNGSEMGAFNTCGQPVRVAQLNAVLADFVPEGMTFIVDFES